MVENDKICIGTKVLIFKYDMINPVGYGYIKNSDMMSDDLSLTNESWKKRIYEVITEDGNIIRGTYGNAYINYTCFRTVKDHVKFLKSKINSKVDEIDKLNKEINEYLNVIDNITTTKIKKK